MPRKLVRSAPLQVRLTPELKRLADELAARENRSLTNLIETLILRAAVAAGLSPQEPQHDGPHVRDNPQHRDE
jgi:hypothetical protein